MSLPVRRPLRRGPLHFHGLEIDAVAFDMDGLLFDTEGLAQIALEETFAFFGAELTPQRYRQLLGIGDEETSVLLRRWLGMGFDTAAFHARCRRRIESLARAGVPLRAGAAELVLGLCDRGATLALVTSNDRKTTERNLDSAGWRGIFEVLVTRECVARGKPDPSPYRLACESLGVAAGRCLALEDTPTGAASAIAAGLVTVLVPDKMPPDPRQEERLLAVYGDLRGVRDAFAPTRPRTALFAVGSSKRRLGTTPTQGYREILEALRAQHFLDPSGSNLGSFEALLQTSLRSACTGQGPGPLFGEEVVPLRLQDEETYALPHGTTRDVATHMEGLPALLAGTVKSNHPRMVKNVVPTPTLTYLSSYLAASVYMGNGVTAEDAGHALLAEIQVSRMYASLAGFDPLTAGGIFTFGGTGTNLYAFRMGLLDLAPDSFLKGAPKDVVVIGSRPAHYSHQTAVSWLGLGRDSYLVARSRRDQTTDVDDLERICHEQLGQGRRIACIVGAGGTTSCMGIDDFSRLAALIDRLVEQYGLDYRPHLHADSVIGWAYLHFVGYDFAANPLGFRPAVVRKLQEIAASISTLKWADSFGMDFHKSGYAPYISSMLVAKSRKKLAALGRESDMMTPLFHNAVAYNPGKYTLETSRSSANMVATLMSVSALGLEGFQTLLGHAQDISMQMKEHLSEHQPELLVVNPDTAGSDVFVRAYPPGVDARASFEKELLDAAVAKPITSYNDAFFAFLSTHWAFGPNALAVSKTSAAFYTETGDPVVALRLYVLNPFLDSQSAVDLIETLREAKDQFDALQQAQSLER